MIEDPCPNCDGAGRVEREHHRLLRRIRPAEELAEVATGIYGVDRVHLDIGRDAGVGTEEAVLDDVEGGGEVGTEGAQILIDKYMLNVDMTPEEIKQRLIDAGVVGAGLGVVMLAGEPWQIVDIGMRRRLRKRKLLRCGFHGNSGFGHSNMIFLK